MLEPNKLNAVRAFQNFTIIIHVYTSSGQFYLTNESTWQKIPSSYLSMNFEALKIFFN